MRGKVVIAGCAMLLVVALLQHHHLQRSVPVVTPKPPERVSTPRPPRPRLPAPHLPATPPPADAAVESRITTNFFACLAKGDWPRLTTNQVEPFLLQNGRSVESLLGAFNATGDRALLKEALEKNPTDPRANFAAYYLVGAYDSSQPASPERRRRLDAFAQSSPENALPHYLAALDSFKAGQTDQAVQQLLAAAQKGKFQDYSRDFIQNAEEAYRAAGWSEAEAKAAATDGLMLPHLSELKQAGLKTVELAQLYRQNGDEASAQAALQLGLGLGQRLTEPGQLTIIQELVGYVIERKVFEAMDPASPIGDAGQTVQGRLDEITQRRKVIKEVVPNVDALLPTLAEPDLVSYFDRIELFGETAAVEWLLKTHGK